MPWNFMTVSTAIFTRSLLSRMFGIFLLIAVGKEAVFDDVREQAVDVALARVDFFGGERDYVSICFLYSAGYREIEI